MISFPREALFYGHCLSSRRLEKQSITLTYFHPRTFPPRNPRNDWGTSCLHTLTDCCTKLSPHMDHRYRPWTGPGISISLVSVARTRVVCLWTRSQHRYFHSAIRTHRKSQIQTPTVRNILPLHSAQWLDRGRVRSLETTDPHTCRHHRNHIDQYERSFSGPPKVEASSLNRLPGDCVTPGQTRPDQTGSDAP